MKAEDIISLLRIKHSEDIFVSECKDGPTQSVRNYLRMDAWVMPRSWSHPEITAYEVKVSRSDFLGDEKWRKYLDLCNYFYFATAPGTISLDELPTHVGLIESSQTGGRLFTRRKAIHREIPEPSAVFRYILMCRSVIRGESKDNGKRDFWSNWLKDRTIDHHFGAMVSQAIRESIEKEIEQVRRENRDLKEQMEHYAEHLKTLDSMGLSRNATEWAFENKLTEIKSGLTDGDIRSIRDASLILPRILAKLT
jgi:hypothetical protein